MELIDNIRKTLKDDFIQEISKGSKLSIASEWQPTDLIVNNKIKELWQ